MESTAEDLLSTRVASSAVDLESAATVDADASGSAATRDKSSANKVDFEARNWNTACAEFKPKHDSEKMAGFLSDNESPQQAKDYCMDQKKRTSTELILEYPYTRIDVNAIEGSTKRTALHWAAKNCKTQVVSLLLRNGADATIIDSGGKTALGLTAPNWSRDKHANCEALIVELITQDGATAAEDNQLMATAAMRDSIQVVEKLIEAGADSFKEDEHGWTPLQIACSYDHIETVDLLAKRKVVVGARPTQWTTALSSITVSEDGLSVENHNTYHKPYTVISNHPVPAGSAIFYFEITHSPKIASNSWCSLAIGFVTQPARFEDYFPGWPTNVAPSWGYHSDDGRIFSKKGGNQDWVNETYGKGETVGCGVMYDDKAVQGKIFFTKEGQSLGWAFETEVVGRLYPAVGLFREVAGTANFGTDLCTNPFKWAPGNKPHFAPEDVNVVAKVDC